MRWGMPPPPRNGSAYPSETKPEAAALEAASFDEVITEFVDVYNSERKRLKKEASIEHTRLERRIGEVEREIKRIVDFIVKGIATDALIPRMNELETERKALTAKLEEAKEADNVIALHPKALDRYKRAVRELADEFKRGTPTEFATIREQVTAIIVQASPSRPGGAGTKANAEDDRSVRIDIKGRLAALCDNPALFPNMDMSGGSLVAGERYRRQASGKQGRKIHCADSACRFTASRYGDREWSVDAALPAQQPLRPHVERMA
jgi:hypothetical protein